MSAGLKNWKDPKIWVWCQVKPDLRACRPMCQPMSSRSCQRFWNVLCGKMKFVPIRKFVLRILTDGPLPSGEMRLPKVLQLNRKSFTTLEPKVEVRPETIWLARLVCKPSLGVQSVQADGAFAMPVPAGKNASCALSSRDQRTNAL